MAAAHSRVNPGWLFGLGWNLFFGMKPSIPKRIHSVKKAVLLEVGCLKKAQRSIRYVRSEAVPADFRVSEKRKVLWNGTPGYTFGFALTLTLTNP